MSSIILICIILVVLLLTHKFSNKTEGFGRKWNYGHRYPRYYPRYSPYIYPRYPSYPSYFNDYYYTPCYESMFGQTICDY